MSAHVFGFYVFGALASQLLKPSEYSSLEHGILERRTRGLVLPMTVRTKQPETPVTVSSNVLIHLLRPRWRGFLHRLTISKSWWQVLCEQLFCVFVDWLCIISLILFCQMSLIDRMDFYQPCFLCYWWDDRWYNVRQLIFLKPQVVGLYDLAAVREPDWPLFHFSLQFNTAVAFFQLIRELETTHSTTHSFPSCWINGTIHIVGHQKCVGKKKHLTTQMLFVSCSSFCLCLSLPVWIGFDSLRIRSHLKKIYAAICESSETYKTKHHYMHLF